MSSVLVSTALLSQSGFQLMYFISTSGQNWASDTLHEIEHWSFFLHGFCLLPWSCHWIVLGLLNSWTYCHGWHPYFHYSSVGSTYFVKEDTLDRYSGLLIVSRDSVLNGSLTWSLFWQVCVKHCHAIIQYLFVDVQTFAWLPRYQMFSSFRARSPPPEMKDQLHWATQPSPRLSLTRKTRGPRYNNIGTELNVSIHIVVHHCMSLSLGFIDVYWIDTHTHTYIYIHILCI